MTSTGCVSCGNEATSDFEALREDFYGDLMCPQCYDEDAEEKYNNEAREQYGIEIYQEDEDELFKVAKGEYDTISYFKTLEEAKAEVDKMRATHDFDYGYIMRVRGIYEDQYTVKDEVELGYWGQYAKDWEDEEDEEDEDDVPHFYHKHYGKLWEVKCNNCDNVNWEEERPKNPKGYRCDDCGIADEQIPRGYTRDINGKLKRKKIKIIFN